MKTLKAIYHSVTAHINPDGSPSIIAWRKLAGGGLTFDTIPLYNNLGFKVRTIIGTESEENYAMRTAQRDPA